MKYFTREILGTLVSDFWGANKKLLCARRQLCLVHLLRDYLTVEQYKRAGKHWLEFAKKARRLIKRLRRHQHELFTFFDQADVPFDISIFISQVGWK